MDTTNVLSKKVAVARKQIERKLDNDLKLLTAPARWEQFCGLLYEELKRDFKKPFTIFFTRTKFFSNQEKQLSSIGIQTQRALLEKQVGEKRGLDLHWDVLTREVVPVSDGQVSSAILRESQSNPSREDKVVCKTGRIEDYMATLSSDERKLAESNPRSRKQAEYEIIKQHLSIDEYRYYSFMLFDFRGYRLYAHVVVHDLDHSASLASLSGRKSFVDKVIGVTWDAISDFSSTETSSRLGLFRKLARIYSYSAIYRGIHLRLLRQQKFRMMGSRILKSVAF